MLRRLFSLPITTRILLTLVIASLVPMLVTAYYNLQGSLDQAERAGLRHIEQLADSVAARLDQLIADSDYLATYVAEGERVRDFLAGEEAARGDVAGFIGRLQRSNDQVALIMIMDRSGAVVSSSNPRYLGDNYGFRDYFQVPFDDQQGFLSILAEYTTGTPTLFFSRPVVGADGDILGVAVVEFEANAITDIVTHGGERETFLLDGHGVVLEHSDKSRRYHSLAPLDAGTRALIRERERFPQDELENLGLTSLANRAVGADRRGSVAYEDPEKGSMIAGFAPVGGSDWVVVVGESAATFAAPLRALFNNVLVSVLVVAALSMVVALLFARTIVRPLRTLTRHVRGLSEEGFTAASGEGLRDLVRSRDDEVGRLAEEFLRMQSNLARYLDNLRETTAAKERIESELGIAHDIQMDILPKIFPPFPDRHDINCDIYAAITPAREVGGDLYDFARREDGRIYFVIGDVSGKGVPASLFMAVTKTLLKATAATAQTPEEVLSTVNDQLAADNDAAMFVTVFCGFLDTRTGELHYANGGHNVPWIMRRDGQVEALSVGSGTVIGALQGVPVAAGCTRLAPGDGLFLYTDGVTEAADGEDALYGDDRLLETLRGLAGTGAGIREVIGGVQADVEAFIDGADQTDDITMMLVLLEEEALGKETSGRA